MIDTEVFTKLEDKGYVEEADARNHVRLWYSGLDGVTVVKANERFFIVQKKNLT